MGKRDEERRVIADENDFRATHQPKKGLVQNGSPSGLAGYSSWLAGWLLSGGKVEKLRHSTAQHNDGRCLEILCLAVGQIY